MVNLAKLSELLFAPNALRGSATALSIKFAGSVLAFALFAFSARHMDAGAFGTLAIIFNAMSFLSVIALCGQEVLITRSWNEYIGTQRPGMAWGALTFSVQVALGATLLVVTVIAVAWPVWDRTVSFSLVAVASLFLFAQSAMNFSGQFSRVAAGVVIGDTPREVLWRGLAVMAVGIYHVIGAGFGAIEFFAIASLALLATVAIQTAWVWRTIPVEVKKADSQRDVRSWIPRSLNMWLSALLDSTGQYLEVILIGVILGPTTAGFYFVATRITNVFAMISAGLSSFATSQISTLYFAGQTDELRRMLRSIAIIGGALVIGGLVVIVAAGKLLLWLFGATYVSAYPALIILGIGASIGALAGPAAQLLLLTGHESIYPRIMAAGLATRFALIAVLGPMLGLMGAAIAWSVSAGVIAVALVVACRRLIGIDPSLSSAVQRIAGAQVRLKGSVP